MINERKTVKYQRMIQFIEFIEMRGPQKLPKILFELGINQTQFKEARYSRPGTLAFEDRGVVIPRPLAIDGYRYKLVETYRSGQIDDGEPPFQMAFNDVLTRQATIYTDVELMMDQFNKTSSEWKALRKVKNALIQVLENMDTFNSAKGGMAVQPSERAQHVLNNLP